MSIEGICDWTKCKQPAAIGYLRNTELCMDCFVRLCNAQEAGKEDWAYGKMGLTPRKKPRLEPVVAETEIKAEMENTEISEISPEISDPPRTITPKVRKRRKRRF